MCFVRSRSTRRIACCRWLLMFLLFSGELCQDFVKKNTPQSHEPNNDCRSLHCKHRLRGFGQDRSKHVRRTVAARQASLVVFRPANLWHAEHFWCSRVLRLKLAEQLQDRTAGPVQRQTDNIFMSRAQAMPRLQIPGCPVGLSNSIACIAAYPCCFF